MQPFSAYSRRKQQQNRNKKKVTAYPLSTLKIPSPLKSARSSFYSSVLLIRYRDIWEAEAHPLISHHLTAFEVTADSYWAVMALPQSLARVPAFARPLKYSHTLASSLSRGGRGVSGLGPAEKALWVSVPSRYTWPISLTNENACPLTSCFCSVCAPVSQAPQRKAGTLGWSVKKEKEFLALLEVRVVLTTRRGFMKNLEVRTREKVM